MSLLRSSSKLTHASRAAQQCRLNSSSTSALAYKLLRNKQRPPLPTLETPKWTAEGAVASILYEAPSDIRLPIKQHVLNCLVQNEPGVLSLVSGTLAARGFNIESLVVSNTEVRDLSRMTIVLREKDAVIEQARRQIEGLVPVYAVLDYSNSEIIKRELLLARISLLGPEYFEDLLKSHGATTTEGSNPSESASHPKNLSISEILRLKHEYLGSITQIVEQFGGKIVDISDRNCIVELSAKPSRISSFLTLMRPFGILEAARSGMMALPRTPLSSDFADEAPTPDADDVVDVSSLPPG